MTRTLVVALAFASALSTHALAAEAAPVPSVVIPWGDYIVSTGTMLTAILLPVLVGLVSGAVYQVAPWARLVLTQSRIEQMTKAVTDYALNAVEGAAKGQTLTIPVGSAVIAKGVQRAVDVVPAKVLAAAGGEKGVAELIFRTLKLEDGANAANTLAPAQSAPAAKEPRPHRRAARRGARPHAMSSDTWDPMTAQPTKKPPTPPNAQAVAAGCGRAVELTTPLPTKSLGEEMVERALRDRTADEDGPRSYVLFAEDWRNFIRRQTPDRLDTLTELIDEQIERRAMRRFWSRIYKLGLLIVPAMFAAAQFGMEKLPLIRDILNLFRKGTP